MIYKYLAVAKNKYISKHYLGDIFVNSIFVWNNDIFMMLKKLHCILVLFSKGIHISCTSIFHEIGEDYWEIPQNIPMMFYFRQLFKKNFLDTIWKVKKNSVVKTTMIKILKTLCLWRWKSSNACIIVRYFAKKSFSWKMCKIHQF